MLCQVAACLLMPPMLRFAVAYADAATFVSLRFTLRRRAAMIAYIYY